MLLNVEMCIWIILSDMKYTLSLDRKAKENSVSQDHTAIEEQSGQDLHYLPF